ncbi:MAG: multifunctional 2',3'-cyclic-nucleotide 2'-phosphodiesterase/5'-nucleotidase/3'-nucleotidase [Clostridia bacterium]|jgi:5'-nucleotidase / UDP-sugar diphosphatase|nr:multifunctional 2',3'-cyclic-nucleotide 2'-phosphodiesterase/5'-nucleotidase/3'-nucleotidase [Clostridia bacterium]MBT7123495.1 multifunctional 2',3'-cyclic-nucleotide 2'-phosphodiesterase/5'-nucleotidase/3'-nucleotidase [Clostridia bacterium]
MNRHVVKSITLVMVLVALLCSFIFAGCATPTSTPEPTEKPASATPEPVETTASTEAPKPVADPVVIDILHTNDVHARAIEGKYDGMGYAKLATLVERFRAANPNTLLIDAGDTFHGKTLATLEEGESIVEIMNLIGYDYMAPGNHDFNYGADKLFELAGMAEFPIISANVVRDGDLFLPAYEITEIEGVKIGLFGLTSEETAYKTHPDNVADITFTNSIEAAQKMVDKLSGEVDIIICIGHIGTDASTLITSEMICDAVSGIDLFIDGHSHTELDGGIVSQTGTVIVSAGEYLQNLGHVRLTYADGMVSIEAELIERVLPNGDVEDLIDGIADAQAEILGEVVGSTDVTLDGERDDVRTGETNLGNLIVDAMIYETGADIALTNGGGIRASIDPGDITIGDIITVLPFGNYIVTTTVTGAQLKEALELGTSSYPETMGAFPHVANITFTINTANAAGSRVEDLMVKGVAVADTDVFVIATNDFMYAGGDGYEMLTNGIENEFAALDEAVIEYLATLDAVPEVVGKITIK